MQDTVRIVDDSYLELPASLDAVPEAVQDTVEAVEAVPLDAVPLDAQPLDAVPEAIVDDTWNEEAEYRLEQLLGPSHTPPRAQRISTTQRQQIL